MTNKFAERIKLLMDERDMTPIQLARASRLDKKTIYSYLNNYGAEDVNNPRAKHLAKLADVFGVSMDYLYGRSDER